MRHRPACYRCHRPECACICRWIAPVENRVGVLVLQHPRERFHPLGTARIAELGLRNVRVETYWPAEGAPQPKELPLRTGLLYPRPGALDLALVPTAERPEKLVVLDGTWHHARTMYRDTPWLQSLPAYALRPEAPSRYRIRREPRAECLSTIESIARALSLCDPDRAGALAGLLDVFDRMIDRQIHELRRRTRSPRHKPSKSPSALPRAFSDAGDRLVVVYGESASIETHGRERARQLMQWTAVRLGSRAVFERILRVDDSFVRPWHLRHMELSEGDVAQGVTAEAFRQSWKEFTKRDDILVAWNHGVLELLWHATGHRGRSVLLKCARAAREVRIRGSIEAVVQREGLVVQPLPVHGRARQRLGNALALTEHYCALARTGSSTGRRTTPHLHETTPSVDLR